MSCALIGKEYLLKCDASVDDEGGGCLVRGWLHESNRVKALCGRTIVP